MFLDPLRNRRNNLGHRAAFWAQGEYFRRFDDAGSAADLAELLAAWRAIETLVGRWSPRFIITAVG